MNISDDFINNEVERLRRVHSDVVYYIFHNCRRMGVAYSIFRADTLYKKGNNKLNTYRNILIFLNEIDLFKKLQ